jgi:hypothetical protein
VAAGNGEEVRLASGVDTGKLWCSSGEDEGTKGGGGELHTVARVSTIVDQNSL